MNHHDKRTLLDFLDGALTDQKSLEVDNHLGQCAQCRDSIETIIGSTIRILGPADPGDSALLTVDEPLATDDEPLLTDEATLINELGLRFVISEEIARGGMGIVYRGFDRELKREVAIKVSRSDQMSVTARFYREAQISAQLQHPGIVPVHELGKLADGKPYIAMRLVKGETLTALIKGTASLAEKTQHIDVFGQICSAMAFAHSRQVVHRDLKPDNVMVGSFGEVQIMDWGLAKKTSQLDSETSPAEQTTSDARAVDPTATQQGLVMGTPAFMAPEQAKGEHATKRSDVFSLGGILLHMLTGHAPFDAASSTQAIAKSANSDLARAFDLLDQTGADSDLISLAKTCLAANPLERPADAEEVSKLFNEYVLRREQELQALKVEEARRKEQLVARKKRSRQWALFAIAMTGALIVSGVAGYMYFSEKNARITKQNMVNEARFEADCRDDILTCCEESFYPEDLKKCRDDDALLPSRLAAAFGDLGIVRGLDLDESAAILTDSAFSDDFHFGLTTWRRELKLENERPPQHRRTAEEIASEKEWLDELIDRAYPDPFRSKIRQLLADGDHNQLAVVIAQPEAVESMANVHAVASTLRLVFKENGPRIEYLQRAHQNFPEEFFLNWYLLVLTTDEETQIQYALSCYAMRPNNTGVLTAVGVTSIESKEYERAAEVLEQLVELEPGYRSGFTNLAIAYEKLGQPEDALEYFNKAVEMESELSTAQAHRFRGRFHREQGNFQLAIDDYQEWLRLSPESAKAHDWLAAVYHDDTKEYQLAVENQVAAAILDPNYKWYQKRLHEYYVSWCQNLKRKGQHEEAAEAELQAIDNFGRLANLVPDNSLPHEELAKLCEKLESYEQAMVSIKKAILLRPEYHIHYNRLSNLCYDRCGELENNGEVEEAVELIEETMEILLKFETRHKRIYRLYDILAGLTRKLGRFEDAIEATKKVIDMVPSSRISIEQLGQLYVYTGQLDLAEETFLGLIETKSDDTGAIARLANLYLVKRMPEKAESVINEALNNDVDSSEIQLIYGKSLIALGLKQNSPEKAAKGRQILDDLKEAIPRLDVDYGNDK